MPDAYRSSKGVPPPMGFILCDGESIVNLMGFRITMETRLWACLGGIRCVY